ncbi:MAG: Chloride/fluoride channel protein [Verrucomicrobiae bacterium]|nr:Chloride/fluoride channel protein [Verrucomicrobiae bacterium]
MKRRVLEQLVLFGSVLKWTFYAAIVGAAVGLSTTVFLRTLTWATDVAAGVPSAYLGLPVVLFVSAVLVRWLAPEAEGHGTERVLAALHERMGRIPLAVVPVKLVATVITLAGGGSAGKEGPCAQIGAGIASGLASLGRIRDVDRRKLVICGVSAGYAAVFGTPIAGALFGVEVLFLGQILYDVLLPSFVAGITAYHVASALGVTYFHFTLEVFPIFTSRVFGQILLLGVWCGLGALLLIEALKLGHRLFQHLRWWKPVNAVLGGALLSGVGGLVSTRYLGLGLETIEDGLRGQVLEKSAFFWKLMATAITLSCGGSGGIVTPIFFLGTAAGNLFSVLFHTGNIATYSAIGMVALLAGAANTPIAASVMAIELFGSSIAPYAAIACIVAFLMSGHRSVYPSQVLSMLKSGSLNATTGKALSQLEDEVGSARVTLPRFLDRYWRK